MTSMRTSDGAALVGDTGYQRVTEQLRAEILDGTLRPGSRIKVVELSRRYGSSQMPIREAIQQLQGEGLVVVVPNRGAAVRQFDRRFVSHIFDIRAALEGALARQAAAVVTDEDLARLHAAMVRHEHEKDDVRAQMENNAAFHRIINAISGNVEATRILNQYTAIIIGLKNRYAMKPKSPLSIERVVESHRAIYSALAAGDEAAAQAEADAHVRMAKALFLNWMDCHPAP